MKRIAIFAAVVLLVLIGIGVMMWNKPHRDISEQATLSISAEQLMQSFANDEAKANQDYLNKALSVSGLVSEVSVNQDGMPVVMLGVSDPLSGVQCTMKDKNVKVVVGQSVKVKGFCNGYTLVVLLSDCIVE